MGLPGRMPASIIAAMVLAPVVLTASGCSVKSCAGQCVPPFQLQVVFRDGTSKQAANLCSASAPMSNSTRRCLGLPRVCPTRNR